LGLQVVFAILILGIPALKIPGVFRPVFDVMSALVDSLIAFSDKGSEFVFGSLGTPSSPSGYVFAFRALPTIIFFSAFASLLFHLGVLQRVVRGIAWVMSKTMGASGAESLSTAANIFIGQTEAPLLVKPYIAAMTRSEILCIMIGGMATIAAGVMAAYVEMLRPILPDIAGHLLTASVMAGPGTIMISKILIPETGRPETLGVVRIKDEAQDGNAIEAMSRGASEGLHLALMVAAMLVAFIGLTALVDSIFVWFGQQVGVHLSLASLLGLLFGPVAWLLGVPWSESQIVGNLLGQKIILNEFVAYVTLTKEAAQLSPRTLIICVYALCGFANIASIGIQVAGIGALAPNQRGQLSRLGLRALLGGTLACLLTAAIAGILF
jgi:CNT family concentrative nucleoside transporter